MNTPLLPLLATILLAVLSSVVNANQFTQQYHSAARPHAFPPFPPNTSPNYGRPYDPSTAPQILVDQSHIDSHITDVLAPRYGINLAEKSSGKRVVEIVGHQLLVDGKPFHINGVCYSPVPIGESPSYGAKGDYFTLDYAYIWQRDLPLLKAMGATAIRIYGWDNHVDHTHFLDAVHEAGLKVVVTYYLGEATENPVRTVDERNKIITDFAAQVARYAEHPAILMWSFGNEINGAWNKFTKQFSDAFGCWWTDYCAGYTDTNSDCQWQSSCMYYQLFSWINAAARAAKMVTTRPIVSGFADVDYMVGDNHMLDKVARFDYLLPDVAAWAVQLYRGATFGGYFWMYRQQSQKPMIVTEYGVDAFNDPCGWPENQWEGGCFNLPGDPAGGDVAPPGQGFWGCSTGGECAKPGVQAQVEWDMRLAKELMDNHPDHGGVVWGGFLMAWTDEYWKGGGTQDMCLHPCKPWDRDWCRGPGRANFKPGGSAMCSYRAHFTCPNWDTQFHDLCGYLLHAMPDAYVNEEWFGITSPIPCWRHDQYGGHRLDSLYVRPAYIGMMQLWTGLSEVDTSFLTCDALYPCWKCTQDRTMDELQDGACAAECRIHEAAVGPGSSTLKARLEAANHTPSATSFWSMYGVPIIVGVVILASALIASGCVMFRRWRSSGSDEERLLATPMRHIQLH